jgi:hypothetical protein
LNFPLLSFTKEGIQHFNRFRIRASSSATENGAGGAPFEAAASASVSALLKECSPTSGAMASYPHAAMTSVTPLFPWFNDEALVAAELQQS